MSLVKEKGKLSSAPPVVGTSIFPDQSVPVQKELEDSFDVMFASESGTDLPEWETKEFPAPYVKFRSHSKRIQKFSQKEPRYRPLGILFSNKERGK